MAASPLEDASAVMKLEGQEGQTRESRSSTLITWKWDNNAV